MCTPCWSDLRNLSSTVLMSTWCRCVLEPELLASCNLHGEQPGVPGWWSSLVSKLRALTGSVCQWSGSSKEIIGISIRFPCLAFILIISFEMMGNWLLADDGGRIPLLSILYCGWEPQHRVTPSVLVQSSVLCLPDRNCAAGVGWHNTSHWC